MHQASLIHLGICGNALRTGSSFGQLKRQFLEAGKAGLTAAGRRIAHSVLRSGTGKWDPAAERPGIPGLTPRGVVRCSVAEAESGTIIELRGDIVELARMRARADQPVSAWGRQ